jgi:hypothetical protein
MPGALCVGVRSSPEVFLQPYGLIYSRPRATRPRGGIASCQDFPWRLRGGEERPKGTGTCGASPLFRGSDANLATSLLLILSLTAAGAELRRRLEPRSAAVPRTGQYPQRWRG